MNESNSNKGSTGESRDISDERHVTVTEGGKTLRGVPTGVSSERPSALKLLSSLKDHAGWLVGESGFQEWRFTGFTRRSGQIYTYGPAVEGPDLEQVMDLPPEKAFGYLLRLARALSLLNERDVTLFPIMMDAVIFTEAGEVLFLPPDFMNKIKDSRSLEYRIHAYEKINHPYEKGEALGSFAIAVLLYRLVTGTYPFTDDTEEGIRARIRNLSVTPPKLLAPGIREEVSSEIMRALNKPESYRLVYWEGKLAKWLEEGFTREISPQERRQIEERARVQKEKAQKSLKRRVFFERHGRTVAIVALAVVVTGAVLGSILKNVLAPRATAGFTPTQVVEAFYTSVNSLDHMMMEDTVVEKAGKSEINEATTLFVLDRQTQAYEGRSYRVPADEWDEEGRPTLDPPFYVHGVADLEIDQERDGENPVFEVTYERWGREDVEAGESPGDTIYEGYDVTDRVYLRRLRKYWVIYQIDRLEMEPIPPED